MRAAQYLAPGRIEAVTVPKPSIGRGEALVGVEACGMCGSDLFILSGGHPRAKTPLTIGHEFCGRVVELDSKATGIRQGDRVSIFPLITCGECLMCKTGNSHVCRHLKLYGIDAPGGMAEFAKLPLNNLIPIGATPPKIGALIEPLAVAVHGVRRAPVRDARTLAVIGAGPIGLLTALVAHNRGTAQVVISDVLPFRVALATRLGLQAVSAGDDMAELIANATNGEGADVVFECVGTGATAASMIQLVRSCGTIINLGVFKKPAEVDLQTLNFRQITLMGSRVYTREDFETAVRLAPELPLELIVTDLFPLEEVGAAFQKFRAGEGVCKVLMQP
jgi:(R,R)-butanediol dehydrogenase / meso-butanediol dehydrogenase / diacetyl reductase